MLKFETNKNVGCQLSASLQQQQIILQMQDLIEYNPSNEMDLYLHNCESHLT